MILRQASFLLRGRDRRVQPPSQKFAFLLGGKLTLTDVRLSYDQLYGGLVKGTFAADEMIVRGFNRKALTQEGAARKIADSVEMTGVDIRTVSSLLADEGRKRLKTLTKHDVVGDLARLAAPARHEPGLKGAAEARRAVEQEKALVPVPILRDLSQ